MEFEGVVVKILPPVSGVSARGDWTKQEVIFEQPGEFPKKVCVSFWGDKAQDAARLKEGDKVTVAANVESKEYNGRWYTEVRAWRMNAASNAVASSSVNMPPIDINMPVAEAGSGSASYSEEFDDLPF